MAEDRQGRTDGRRSSGSDSVKKSHVNIDRIRRLQSFAGKEIDWQMRLFIHHFLDGRHRGMP